MNIITILLFALVLVVLVISGLWELLFLTFFIYIVSPLYPWLRKIAAWAAKAENLLPLILVDTHGQSPWNPALRVIGAQVYRMDL
jgi:hypothetical protein